MKNKEMERTYIKMAKKETTEKEWTIKNKWEGKKRKTHEKEWKKQFVMINERSTNEE